MLETIVNQLKYENSKETGINLITAELKVIIQTANAGKPSLAYFFAGPEWRHL